MTEKPLSPKVAAEQLGVDPQTLAEWARAGKIDYFLTVGGHRRYTQATIDAMIASRKREKS